MKQQTIILTPTILTVLQNMPTEEVERVLREAFPQLFNPSTEEPSEEVKQFLHRLRTMPVPTPTTDTDEDLRARRNERHEL